MPEENVSVKQIFKSEKTRVKSILGERSSQIGKVMLSCNISEELFCDAGNILSNVNLDNPFLNIITHSYLNLDHLNSSGLFYITGCKAFKCVNKLNC